MKENKQNTNKYTQIFESSYKILTNIPQSYKFFFFFFFLIRKRSHFETDIKVNMRLKWHCFGIVEL